MFCKKKYNKIYVKIILEVYFWRKYYKNKTISVSFYQNERYYNDVCWLTSHNSFAYKNTSFKHQLFPNQIRSIKKQLLLGVRSFMIDLHYDNNEVVIAHGGFHLFNTAIRSVSYNHRRLVDKP